MAIRRLQSILTTCTALALLSFAAEATAQDAATAEQSGTTLRPITLKGTRLKAGDAENTPTSTETTEAQLEAKQVDSIEDLGRTLDPGVNFNRATKSLNIRGLEGNRVTTLVDGIPLTYFNDGARGVSGGADSVDFFSLTTVNVVKGADSSRIGDGALGGALLLRTLEPEDLIGEGKDWGGKVGAGYDSMDNSKFGGAAIAKKIDNTSVLFLGSYKKGNERDNRGSVGGFGSTRTKTNPADYDQYNLLFKLRQDTDSGHRFGFTAEHFDFDKDIDLRQAQTLTGNFRPGNHSSGEESQRTRFSLDYEYEATSADSLIDAAEATLYWQRQKRVDSQNSYRFTSVPGVFTRNNESSEAGFGFSGFFDSGFDVGSVNHVFTLGTSMFFSKAEQYSAGVDSCDTIIPTPFACGMLHTNQSDMPDVDSSKVSVYAQDRMAFGDSGFSLTPGIRFDWYDHSPQDTPAYLNNPATPVLPSGSSDNAFSPKILAEYEVNDKLMVFGQWAMGFRSPTSNEMYLTYGGTGSYLRIGNPDLEAETSNGFEVGARLGDNEFGGSVNLFYNRYRNFIDSRSYGRDETEDAGYDYDAFPLGVSGYQNIARAKIYGAEFSVHKNFVNGFNTRAGLAFTRGINMETDRYLNSVAPLKAIIGVGYATETWGVDALWTGVKGVSDKSTASFKAPGYGLVDLTAWWEPEQVKGLSIQAGIYNVFDRKYWDALNTKDATVPAATKDYFTEPGRTFKISLTQRF